MHVAVHDFSATRIKKSLTGRGKASKEQVARSVQSYLSLPKKPEPYDVSDAIAAAFCGLDYLNKAKIVESGSGRRDRR
jgi:crossover junction endodeoxyribonuclease RuvC